VKSRISTDLQCYTDQGYPSGIEIKETLTIIPALTEINTTKGNSAGTWVTFTGSGFGPNDQNLNIRQTN